MGVALGNALKAVPELVMTSDHGVTVEVGWCSVGFGSTQSPPGFDTHSVIPLEANLPMLPHTGPTSGFQDTSCGLVNPSFDATVSQVSPTTSSYELQCMLVGMQTLPLVGKLAQ